MMDILDFRLIRTDDLCISHLLIVLGAKLGTFFQRGAIHRMLPGNKQSVNTWFLFLRFFAAKNSAFLSTN